MAFKLDTCFNGVTIAGAYWKVQRVVIEGGQQMIVLLTCAAARDMPPVCGETYGVDYDPEAGNPVSQAYTYLRALPEFSGASDVLEEST